jgi:magnesium chelatase family protein
MPLRTRQRAGFLVQTRRQSALRRRLSGAPLRAAARPHRPAYQSAGGHAADLILPPPAEGSAHVKARVAQARDIQATRYRALGLDGHTNAQASGTVLESVAKPDQPGLALLREASEAMGLTARGYQQVLRVARTLADLDGEDMVRHVHFAEALAYRALTDEMRRAA